MWNEENPAQGPAKYYRLRKIDHKEYIFLNIFASFGKIIRNILTSICRKFDKNLYCPGAPSYIKNNFIIVIVVTSRDKVSEGKLYFLVGKKGNEIGGIEANSKSEEGGWKSWERMSQRRKVTEGRMATPSAITMP